MLLTLEGLLAHAAGYRAILLYAPWFFMGAAAYSISKFAKPTISSKWFVVCLTVLVASPFLAHRLVSSDQSIWILLAAGILFAFSLSHFLNVTVPVLVRPCRVIARYSYGIYLAHVPILWFVFRKMSGQPQWLQTAMLILLMVSVPVVLYHLIEEPLIRKGASISRALMRPAEVALPTRVL
jgi:peptidoglycan/LPS O-acetylase OafA/YrhL